MIELEGFTKEERITFGLNIMHLERTRRNGLTGKRRENYLKKLEKLKKERAEFLQALEDARLAKIKVKKVK